MTHSTVTRPHARGAWLVAGLLAALPFPADAADRYWPPIVDPPSGQYSPGRFVWGDLVTSDVAAAADFYGKVFGWTFETYGGDDDLDTYTLALADGLPIGGMVYDKRAMKGTTPSARWIGLVSVADVKATAAAVTSAGGKVVREPVMLGERGETAVFSDPEGVLFGVVKSKSGDPPDYAGELNEWYWVDLWTRDVDKASTFYRTVLGYETVPVESNGPRNGVRLMSGGVARAGIMRKQNDKSSAAWLPYIRVANAREAAANATLAGGKVLLQPIAMGDVIVAIVADPTGAPVGVVQLPAAEVLP